MKIHHIGLIAQDPSQSVAFYTRLLGGTVATQAGHTIVYTEHLRIAIVPRRPEDPPGHARGHHLAFVLPLEEQATLRNNLAAMGVECAEVQDRLYARDPDGFNLEFVFASPEIQAQSTK